MARTLIGNIKGKDGRGITSIEKTGTTGPVDTYTITYTDSTTSTFTVNNSDNIALQRQIVPSAAVESSDTASQAYVAGDYVVVNGILRRATAAIAKGNAISDSNSTTTTVAGELAALGDSISRTDTLYGGSSIVSGSDLNNFKRAGCWKVSNNAVASSLKNCPVKQAFCLRVRQPLDDDGFSSDVVYAVQELLTYRNLRYARYYDGFTDEWGEWKSY